MDGVTTGVAVGVKHLIAYLDTATRDKKQVKVVRRNVVREDGQIDDDALSHQLGQSPRASSTSQRQHVMPSGPSMWQTQALAGAFSRSQARRLTVWIIAGASFALIAPPSNSPAATSRSMRSISNSNFIGLLLLGRARRPVPSA